MPGPYRAAAGKPYAVRKRPRRGQDPSLRTAPSTSVRPYSDYVNDIRRAGCPHPAASSRGYPSTGSHPRRGRRPRRPGNLPSPPIPGKTPGPGMPGPYRAAVGKPHAVRKRPRRGQDPSLQTDPSTSARPYRAYVNDIRRAGCPHPAASSRGHYVNGQPTHVGGGVPDAPETFCRRPSPGPPRPGMPAPYRAAVGKPPAVRKRPRRGQDPSLRTAPSTSARPPTARRCGNGDKKTEAIPFPGTASVLYISA